MVNDPILKVEDLVIESDLERDPATGKNKQLVKGVSFELQRGEVLGLIGESGAGKTTIGLSALCYSRPGCRISGGRIDFDGTDLRTAGPDHVRDIRGRSVAYIAQSAAASFNPALRLKRQAGETAVRHNLENWAGADKRSVELFEELNLPSPEHFGNKYPHQVSGGQLQRAMAAMAVTCNPSVLVLDEPTTALDVTTQIEVLMTLRKLIHNHNAAALYISHDLAVVAQVADRIMVLRNGQCVEVGTAEQIMYHPREQYTKDLLAVRASDTEKPFLPPVKNETAKVLEVDNLTASYRSLLKVVENVTFDIKRGETVALVGESGSGKSSLARAICGLVQIDKGSVKLNGDAIPLAYSKRSKDQLKKMQLVYQMPDMALNPRHKIGKIIGRAVRHFNGGASANVDAEVAELLRMVDLPEDFANRLPRDLSGGQKQRVCVARALAAKPDVLVCDEVTSALDSLVAEELLALLARIQNEVGLGILFITHDLGLVRRTANRVLVMFKGEVVDEGTVEEVYSPPHHPYTEKLLASVPEMRLGWLDEVVEKRGASMFEDNAA